MKRTPNPSRSHSNCSNRQFTSRGGLLFDFMEISELTSRARGPGILNGFPERLPRLKKKLVDVLPVGFGHCILLREIVSQHHGLCRYLACSVKRPAGI